MAEVPHQQTEDLPLASRVERLEARMLELESRIAHAEANRVSSADLSPLPPVQLTIPGGRTQDELEYEVGQNWFAKAGIVVLAVGASFTLSLPGASLPAVVPSLCGYVFVATLLGLAHVWRASFAMVAGYLRAAGLALLYFATLRLSFFGEQHVFSPGSIAAVALLTLATAGIIAAALRWKSPWIFVLGLGAAAATGIAAGSTPVTLLTVLLLAALIISVSRSYEWPVVVVTGIPLTHATYLVWALNNPLLGHPMHFVGGSLVGPGTLLASVIILSLGTMFRRDRSRENVLTIVSALLNCALGYGIFLVHTSVAFSPAFALAHVGAFLAFLGLAVTFWVREQSRASTFFYAMTGYVALSMAIVKVATGAEVFVWLSLQSVVVVATAIWFRSRFIIVANFLIYVAIVLGYMFAAERETGISVGFGIVALISARILNWQKSRLELKTELMRNAYLLSAFIVFPYALYHLVPGRYVGLAWVGLAVFYYVMNLVVRSQKFRWMGHSTLLLTTLYLVIIGTSRFEPVYRVLSFLVLGTVLLIVSLSFTRLRTRERSKTGGPPPP